MDEVFVKGFFVEMTTPKNGGEEMMRTLRVESLLQSWKLQKNWEYFFFVGLPTSRN